MKAILTDVTKCIGCAKCVDACAKEFHQKPDFIWRWSSKDGLSGRRFSSILRLDGDTYVRKQCRHCLQPACVSVCPVGALQKTEMGPVVYDSDKCMGCRYCMMSCPFGIPRYTWEQKVPLVRKCTMCYENRVRHGRQPACTEACPEKATIFGERDELLQEAHRRIEAEPEKYLHKVYGEYEVGGTSVIYISDVNLDFLGWQADLGREAVPHLTTYAMESVLPAFFTVGIAMGSIYWIIERRRRVAAEETGTESEQPSGEQDGKE